MAKWSIKASEADPNADKPSQAKLIMQEAEALAEATNELMDLGQRRAERSESAKQDRAKAQAV